MDSIRPRRVHIYARDCLPSRDGSGTNSRIYSNVRAYLDLGYEVEVVYFQTKRNAPFAPEVSLPNVRWTHLQVYETQSTLLNRTSNRLAYWSGWPINRALDYRFKTRQLVRREVRRREAAFPGSLHHFEYVATACAAIHLAGVNCIWSHHDIESDFAARHQSIRHELEGRHPQGHERRSLKYLKQAERLAARHCRLILCIARHECDVLRRQWECKHAEFFPMSVPVEESPLRTRTWVEGSKLRLFHLGRIDSLPSFRSLQFLLEKVFPLLGESVLRDVELIVVGEIRETERSKAVLSLAHQYPQVRFTGFQKDIRRFYGDVDLQLVGSSEATGLRTRIVESFAYGVPVLSTTVGAAGVEGLMADENIILADEPEQFAQNIKQLLREPSRLAELARAGKQTYEAIYSRSAVASKLNSYLVRHIEGSDYEPSALFNSEQEIFLGRAS